ncbi:hypothetical protein [Nocardia farcinica]|uniref:hypothetical protein n=1 Tax=Nocardia farcinica TaxID=37329 RepID=UPI002453B6AF|nr:hypothetical protein [Nocardia farcinica]
MTTRKTAAEKVRVEGLPPHEIQHAGNLLCKDLDKQCEALALKALGIPAQNSEQWQQWRGASGTTRRREQDARVALAKIAVFVTAGLNPTNAVVDARGADASWSQIGAAAGITKQGAQIRWADHVTAILVERDAAAERRARSTPLVSPLDEYDAAGKGTVGEATRSRRGRRQIQPRPSGIA